MLPPSCLMLLLVSCRWASWSRIAEEPPLWGHWVLNNLLLPSDLCSFAVGCCIKWWARQFVLRSKETHITEYLLCARPCFECFIGKTSDIFPWNPISRDCKKFAAILTGASSLYVCVLNHFSRVWLCATLWTLACQAPLSMGFSRHKCCSELLCPPPGDIPDLGIKLVSFVSIRPGRWVLYR